MDESKSWIGVAIFVVGTVAGIALASFCIGLWNADDYKVTPSMTRQEIFSLPDGTTWKRIRTPEEVK